MVKKCRGRDLNSRTSTGQGPQPCAVGQAWLPLHDEKNPCDACRYGTFKIQYLSFSSLMVLDMVKVDPADI